MQYLTNMKYFTLILPALLLLNISVTLGQDWFSEIQPEEKINGFIIGIAGDTINGMIQYDYPIIMQNTLSFTHVNTSGREVQYQPFDIWGYSFNGIHYESIQVNMDTYQGTYTFNRFGILSSVPGAIGIYRIYPEKDKLKKNISSLEAEMEFEKIQRNPPKDDFSTLYIKKLEDPAICMGTRSFQKNFIEHITPLIADHEELFKKVENKEYTIDNVYQIVMEYNQFYKSEKFRK